MASRKSLVAPDAAPGDPAEVDSTVAALAVVGSTAVEAAAMAVEIASSIEAAGLMAMNYSGQVRVPNLFPVPVDAVSSFEATRDC